MPPQADTIVIYHLAPKLWPLLTFHYTPKRTNQCQFSWRHMMYVLSSIYRIYVCVCVYLFWLSIADSGDTQFDLHFLAVCLTAFGASFPHFALPSFTFSTCLISIDFQVYAVVVSHEQTSGDLSPAAVSYTSGFYSIPVIGISSRDAAFSDKNIHVSFLRTVPPYYHQADVWLEMLSHFLYTKVGRQMLPALMTC